MQPSRPQIYITTHILEFRYEYACNENLLACGVLNEVIDGIIDGIIDRVIDRVMDRVISFRQKWALFRIKILYFGH